MGQAWAGDIRDVRTYRILPSWVFSLEFYGIICSVSFTEYEHINKTAVRIVKFHHLSDLAAS